MALAVQPKPRNLAWLWLLLIVLGAVAVIWRLDLLHFDFKQAGHDLVEYFSQFRHPDFRDWKDDLGATLQTLSIAIWGTALAVVFGLLLAPLAARQIAPNRAVYHLFREVFSALRAIPDVIFATLFVLALSPGPHVGVLALALHGIGFLGKTLAENLERADPKVFEAMNSVGASRAQTVVFGGYPAIARDIIGFGLYTFDRNVRMAVVLGIVGAGGIGIKLKTSIDEFRPNETAAVMLIILVTVLIIEVIADALRKRFA
jgi:phosphonate transport system permease protein